MTVFEQFHLAPVGRFYDHGDEHSLYSGMGTYVFFSFYSALVGRCMILAMIFLAVRSLVHIMDSKVVAAFHMTRNRSQ